MAEQRSFKRHRPMLTFDIEGEVFEAMTASGPMFIDFIEQTETASELEMAVFFREMFASCITPESEFERFWKVCRAELDINGMMELLEYLAGRSANRPTQPPSRSPRGRAARSAGAASSKLASISKDSISEQPAT